MQARPAAVIRQLALFFNKFSQTRQPDAERARLQISMPRENLEPIERETGRNRLNQKHRAYIAKLHEARAPAMRQMAERHLADKSLADDLVQEVFLTACRRAEVFCEHPEPEK